MARVFGGIEAGGTKFVCAVGTQPDALHDVTQFPTTTPDETLGRAVQFFRTQKGQIELTSVGIASFGPIDPNPRSPTYGYITSTPKSGWANTDIAGTIRGALGVPVRFDTDVNGAALAENRWGAAQRLNNCIYITIGTGIGGGGLVNGELMHGLVHPEMGHIRIPHDWQGDPYKGHCPFHGDCWEGLASGPAIEERWGQLPESLPTDHPAWRLEAHYIALAVSNLICTLSPERIVIGGGVMQQPELLPLVRQQVRQLLNGYIQNRAVLDAIDRFIVPPSLGNRAGVLGAIALGQLAAQETR
jgi:fructokinase